jgi:hypothetical protein
VIPFIEKTWFLWWMLAVVVILRWFYVLSAPAKVNAIDTLASEEERAYILSWRLLRKAQAISLSFIGD